MKEEEKVLKKKIYEKNEEKKENKAIEADC